MSLEEERKFPKVEPGQPSVIVKKSEPADKAATAKPAPETKGKTEGDVAWGARGSRRPRPGRARR